ncbi:ferritin-like domain-containing protein [Conexibacter sp. SYSU D00693]|uniref:ferritin-like domain-containing protein n=1 Tax=Conexibacter sp. SYSU D00693 TaxID=2812560 RepID=UPI00196B2F86|nr:ferritin-like domain-containing protein [Conexibacter sp. SYSU D00693]
MVDDIDVLPIEDTDGAFAEALEGAGGGTRRQLLQRAGIAGGALAGAGALFGGFAPAAGAATRRRDVQILQFALVAERLGAAFYREALEKAGLEGATRTYAETARRDEVTHVAAVQRQIRKLGGRPAAAPRFRFGAAVQSQKAFQDTALMIETMCVRVLNGAGPLVTKSTLAAAGALVSVEARQVAWLSTIVGQDPAPAAYDQPLSLAAAQRRVRATGFVRS